MKYWGLRYVCVDFDPPPPAHLFSAPAPRANSHQSRDFTFLRARDLPSLRFTHCVLLLSQRAVTVHPVLFSLLIYLVSRRQRARQSHSRLRIFLTSHQWKRKQVNFGEPQRVWLTGRRFYCCCAQVLPKKNIPLEYRWAKCQFLLNQGTEFSDRWHECNLNCDWRNSSGVNIVTGGMQHFCFT